MRKLSVILGLIFCISIVACNKSSNNNKEEISDNQENTSSETVNKLVEPEADNTNEEIVGVEYINQNYFITKIYDYKNNKIKSDIPVIVDFSASWCGPCKMIAPYFDDLQKKYQGKIRIYKVDVDNEPNLAKDFNVTSIPFVIFINKKGEMKNILGANSKDKYEEIINNFLLK